MKGDEHVAFLDEPEEAESLFLEPVVSHIRRLRPVKRSNIIIKHHQHPFFSKDF